MTVVLPAAPGVGRRRSGLRLARLVDVAGLGSLPIVAVVGVVIASPLVAVTGPVVVALALGEVRRRRRWRHEVAQADALPLVVDQLVQRLRAGSSLARACRSLDPGPGGDVVAPLIEALGQGRTLRQASQALGVTTDPSVRLLSTTLGLLAANGGPAVPALRRLRHTLVGRSHRHRRASAQAASALSSAGLLVLAPTAFGLVLAGTEPDLARFYGHDPIGAACATGSVLLSALGWWWIHRLVGRFRSVDR
ncbi:MAG: hypothetical protein AAFO29_16365 [Actinomycetota bacterium]